MFFLQIGQETCYDSKKREKGTHLENVLYACTICQPSEEGRAETAQAKHKSEEHTGYESHLVGHQISGIDHY